MPPRPAAARAPRVRRPPRSHSPWSIHGVANGLEAIIQLLQRSTLADHRLSGGGYASRRFLLLLRRELDGFAALLGPGLGIAGDTLDLPFRKLGLDPLSRFQHCLLQVGWQAVVEDFAHQRERVNRPQ